MYTGGTAEEAPPPPAYHQDNAIQMGQSTASAPLGPVTGANGNLDYPSTPPPAYSNVDFAAFPNVNSQETMPPPDAGGYVYIDVGDPQPEISRWEGPGYKRACKRSPHLKSWTLTVTFVIMLIVLVLELSGLIKSNRNLMIGLVCFIALVYVSEICCSNSCAYLREVNDKNATHSLVERMKAATPSIRWNIQCYHYETRVHKEKDENGHVRTRTEKVRIDTHAAVGYFQYVAWCDTSAPLTGMDNHRLTKLKIHKKFAFDSAMSQNEFKSQKAYFKRVNKRDKHFEFSETFIVPGFVSRILCEAQDGDKPYCLKLKFYLLFHLIFLGPCYRWWFSSICGNKVLCITKILSCNSGAPITGAV